MKIAIIILAITIMCRKADNKLSLTFECIQNLVGGTGFAEKVTEWQQNSEEAKSSQNSKLHRTHLYTCCMAYISLYYSHLWRLNGMNLAIHYEFKLICNHTPQTLWIAQLFRFLCSFLFCSVRFSFHCIFPLHMNTNGHAYLCCIPFSFYSCILLSGWIFKEGNV